MNSAMSVDPTPAAATSSPDLTGIVFADSKEDAQFMRVLGPTWDRGADIGETIVMARSITPGRPRQLGRALDRRRRLRRDQGGDLHQWRCGRARAGVCRAPPRRARSGWRPGRAGADLPPRLGGGRDAAGRLAARTPEVDGKRMALMGRSWGGYLAQRAATAEHRVAAVISDAGQFDPGPPGALRDRCQRAVLPAQLRLARRRPGRRRLTPPPL
jgi:hypothetical protein